MTPSVRLQQSGIVNHGGLPRPKHMAKRKRSDNRYDRGRLTFTRQELRVGITCDGNSSV